LGGIYLYNCDGIIEDNNVTYVGQYGIYSYSSDAFINDCNFDSLDIGIYCNSYSDPKIRRSLFVNTADVGVQYYVNCDPNLGYDTSTAEWGNNDFEVCEDYFIKQVGIGGLILVKAERNYFGYGTPDSSKFSGTIDYHPWLTRPPNLQKGAANGIELPLVYQLGSNYPNPFNPITAIKFSLAEPDYTSIEIYNILGQKVTTLIDEYKQAGKYSIIWRGTNSRGQPVASGIYFYRLVSGDFIDSKKMLILR
jgi:parallel beta-helix repeat protein